MGFILLLFLCCLTIGLINFMPARRTATRIKVGFTSFAISSVCCILLMCIVWLWSWDTTVDMKQNLANLSAYKHTIETYKKNAMGEFKAGAALTDLKYQNYQQQIGQMITDLRGRIVSYNNSFVGKNAYKDNWLWSWCIFAPPEGSQLLEMSDYIK